MFDKLLGRGVPPSTGCSTDDEKKEEEEEEHATARHRRHRRQSVYEEAMEMLTASLIIYIFAEIRAIAKEEEEGGGGGGGGGFSVATTTTKKKKKKNTNDDDDEDDVTEDSHRPPPDGEKMNINDLQCPLTGEKVLRVIRASARVLKERSIGHEDLEKRLIALQQIQQQAQQQRGNGNGILSWLRLSSMMGGGGAIVTHFCDDNSQKEIVHSIAVNPTRQRITVIFRGSVTRTDFVQDAKCAQVKLKNPVERFFDNPEHTTPTISLHAGFQEYLNKKNDALGTTRLGSILNDVKDLLRGEYSGYMVFATGHSLGGALATLFGFYAAADDEIWNLTNGTGVAVYSVASPLIGNWKFKNAFQHLERLQRLQHFRIANAEDMITLSPFFAPKLTILSPLASAFMGAGNLYKHVGLALVLEPKPEQEEMEAKEEEGGIRSNNVAEDSALYSLAYYKDRVTKESEYAKEVQDSVKAGVSMATAFYNMTAGNFDKVLTSHSCIEYEKRLERCQPFLSNISLDDLYKDKSIVGKVLDRSYEPAQMESGMNRTKRALTYWTKRDPSSSAEEKCTTTE